MKINLNKNNIITDLSDYGLICISGADAEKFLQGQLTCNMREVNAQQSRLGAYCNVKGRVLASFRIFSYQDQYYLSLPKNMIEVTLAQLQKYAVFSKVNLLVVNDLVHTGCSGPDIEKILATIFSKIPNNVDEVVSVNEFLLLRIPGPVPRFEIFSKPSAIKKLLTQLSQKMMPVSADIWQLLDIHAGIPTIYPKTLGMFTPHMLNLPQLNAVSFNKGCYLGQEIIARTQYLGKSKRQMYRAQVNTNIALLPGDPLINNENQEIGNVVSGVKSSETTWEILVVLQEEVLRKNEIYLKNDHEVIHLISGCQPSLA